jgi:hypothetical protein
MLVPHPAGVPDAMQEHDRSGVLGTVLAEVKD